MPLWDIVGYAYKANIYCPTDIVDELQTRGDLMDAYPAGFNTESWLDNCAKVINLDRYDESSFDSDYFPKVIFEDQAEDDYCCICNNKLRD